MFTMLSSEVEILLGFFMKKPSKIPISKKQFKATQADRQLKNQFS